MEFVLDHNDQSTLVKWDKEHNLLKTFSPDHYRIVSEKEYQALKAQAESNETVGALALKMTEPPKERGSQFDL